MKMISSEDTEEWLKETYEYLQKLKDDKYGDVKLDYIMLYEIHKEEHKELKRLNNIINELQEENKRIKTKWKTIWKDINVIIRNDKSIILNTNALDYLLDLEDKIDKSIDFVDSNIEDEYEWNGLLYHNEVKDKLLNILERSD